MDFLFPNLTLRLYLSLHCIRRDWIYFSSLQNIMHIFMTSFISFRLQKSERRNTLCEQAQQLNALSITQRYLWLLRVNKNRSFNLGSNGGYWQFKNVTPNQPDNFPLGVSQDGRWPLLDDGFGEGVDGGMTWGDSKNSVTVGNSWQDGSRERRLKRFKRFTKTLKNLDV